MSKDQDEAVDDIFDEDKPEDEDLECLCPQCFEPVKPGKKFCSDDCRKDYDLDSEELAEWDELDEEESSFEEDDESDDEEGLIK